MTDEKKYTLRQGSKKIGKNPKYLSNLLKIRPQYFEGIVLEDVNTKILIKESDLPIVLSRVKKRGGQPKYK
ncbi:hypothetical protein MKL18_13485 [Enterococcus faecalis]|uniref:hypothetical protein n=1 Tax=Enterococcus faecalis TaxID=1351 RepID=UPI001F066739|nr:hypothetical protein [Enterococcus faecalis]MCH1672943.1 hypothetical protein [Enterococcus faecalis]